jgi:hypothetical protein
MLWFIIFSTPLMGRKQGYTVDANANFYLTKAMVQTGVLFPDIPVKQGFIYSIVFIPFYWVGDLLQSRFPELPADYFPRVFLCWMNTVLTGLTVGVFSLLIRRFGFSLRAQVWIPLMYGFSTFAFVYARYDYNKCLAAFFLLTAFYFWIAYQDEQNVLFLLVSGVFLGLLITLRLEMGIVFPVWCYSTFHRIRQTRRKPSELFALIIPVLFGFLFVYGYNRHYWQGGLQGGYETGFGLNPFPAMVGFLLSPGKSVFLFNPVLLLLPFVIRSFRNHSADGFRLWSGTVGFLFLLYCFWGNWWGGWGFGPRHLVPLLPLLMLPLAVVIDGDWLRYRLPLVLSGIIGFSIQLTGSAVAFTDVIYTLMKAEVTEPQLIWNPVWNPILQHGLFLSHMPLPMWDFALIAWSRIFPPFLFVSILLVWIFCLVAIGYRLIDSMRLEPANL